MESRSDLKGLKLHCLDKVIFSFSQNFIFQLLARKMDLVADTQILVGSEEY